MAPFLNDEIINCEIISIGILSFAIINPICKTKSLNSSVILSSFNKNSSDEQLLLVNN